MQSDYAADDLMSIREVARAIKDLRVDRHFVLKLPMLDILATGPEAQEK